MIHRIAFAGPPASGKSTTLELLRNYAHAPNVHIIFLDEVATSFMNWPEYIASHDDPLIRQYYIMKTQIMLEDMAMQKAVHSEKEIILIVSDRAVIDLYVYLNDDEAAKIVTDEDAEKFADRYDHVLFFETTGEAQFLSHNNPSRHEQSYSEIQEVGERTYEAWKKHSRCEMIFIPPADTIEQKVNNVAQTINDVLGIKIWKIR